MINGIKWFFIYLIAYEVVDNIYHMHTNYLNYKLNVK